MPRRLLVCCWLVAAFLLSSGESHVLVSRVRADTEKNEVGDHSLGHGMALTVGLEFAGGLVSAEVSAAVNFAQEKDPKTGKVADAVALSAELGLEVSAGVDKIAVGSAAIAGSVEIKGVPPAEAKSPVAKAKWLLEQWMVGMVQKNPVYRFYADFKKMVSKLKMADFSRSPESILKRQFELAAYARKDIVDFYDTEEPDSSKGNKPLKLTKEQEADNKACSTYEETCRKNLDNTANYLHLEFLRTLTMYVVQGRTAPKTEKDWADDYVERAWRRVYLGKQVPKTPGTGIMERGPECSIRCTSKSGKFECDQKKNTAQHQLELYRGLENVKSGPSAASKKEAKEFMRNPNSFKDPHNTAKKSSFLEVEAPGKFKSMLKKHGNSIGRMAGAASGFRSAGFMKTGSHFKPADDKTKLLVQAMTCRFFVRNFLQDDYKLENWRTRKNRNIKEMIPKTYPALFKLNPPPGDDGQADVYITEDSLTANDWNIAKKNDKLLQDIKQTDPDFLKIYKLIRAMRSRAEGNDGTSMASDGDHGFSGVLTKSLSWAVMKHYTGLLLPQKDVEANQAELERLMKDKKNSKPEPQSALHSNVCKLKDDQGEPAPLEITATLALSASVGTEKGAIKAAVVGGGYYASLSRESSWAWKGNEDGKSCKIARDAESDESANTVTIKIGKMLSMNIQRFDGADSPRTIGLNLAFEDLNSLMAPVNFPGLCTSGFASWLKSFLRGLLFPVWFGSDDEGQSMAEASSGAIDASKAKVAYAKSRWTANSPSDVKKKVVAFISKLKQKLADLKADAMTFLKDKKAAEKVIKVMKDAASSAAGWMVAATAASAIASAAGLPNIKVEASNAFEIGYIMHPDPKAKACHDQIAFTHSGGLSVGGSVGTGTVGVELGVEVSREESVSCAPADPPPGSLTMPSWCATMRRFGSRHRTIVGC